jgi:hypothetical protein
VNVNLLIDAIVRQTTVLIAELATSRGLRAPLAHIADQVFVELTRELEAQGLSRKVSADMFGMALRTYQRKVQRLEESATERGRSLWEAVYDFVRSRSVVTRRDILERFRGDDEEVVRGVITDLVESSLVFATGPTQSTTFRAATDAELGDMVRHRRHHADADLVWALVFRLGPIAAEGLASLGRFEVSEIEAVLERLVAADRVTREDTAAGAVYRTSHFYVPVGASSGWEAAVFDHFHAVVRTICAKLRRTQESSPTDQIGGSTYSFEVWDGHPLEEEVTGALRRFREEYSALRERVRTHNERNPKPARRVGVVVYAGQTIWDIENGKETSNA